MQSLFKATSDLPPQAYGFFFDIDGTLAPIAPKPDEAQIPSELLSLITIIQHGGNPVAMISGRTLQDIDRMCEPAQFCAAGQHGLEVRHGDGAIYALSDTNSVMADIAKKIESFQAEFPDLLVEYKGLSIVVHYRNAPYLGEEVDRFLTGLASEFSDAVELQKGKMVGELRLKGASKGEAIRQLMQTALFAECIPVFAGDDITDESGFAVVNALGGISIKIGEGNTEALHRLDSPTDLHEWLKLFQQTKGASV